MQRVRSSSFRVATIMGPLILGALVGLPTLVARQDGPSKSTVAVVDSAGLFAAEEALLEDEIDEPVQLWKVPLELGPETLSGLIEDRAIDGAVFLAANGGSLELMRGPLIGPAHVRTLRSYFFRIITEARLAARGLSEESIAAVTQPIPWKVTAVSTGPDPVGAARLALAVAFLLYGTLLTYGLATMRAVVEEKSSRVIEMLLTSLRPSEILAGKIIGVAAVGLTQYVVWFLLSGVLLASSISMGTREVMTGGLSPPTPWLMCACVGYFVLGYVLFAALYAIVGAMVSSTSDAHHLHLPVTGLLIIPVLLVSLVMVDPGSSWARIASLIPPFAPVLMVARLAMGSSSAGEVVLSVVLLLSAIAGSLVIAGRVYRTGILMLGKPATLREVWRWIRDQ